MLRVLWGLTRGHRLRPWRLHGEILHPAQDDWQIEAHYPGAEIRYIKPFKSKAKIDEWLNGTLRIDWLRSQGYAK